MDVSSMTYKYLGEECTYMHARMCYICLDPVEEALTARCACRMAAHASCLRTMMIKMDTRTCTICKAPFTCTFDLEAARPTVVRRAASPRRCATVRRTPGIVSAMCLMLGLLVFACLVDGGVVAFKSLVVVACVAYGTGLLCICMDVVSLCGRWPRRVRGDAEEE